MIEILKRDTSAGNQAIQLCLDAFYGMERPAKLHLLQCLDYAVSIRIELHRLGERPVRRDRPCTSLGRILLMPGKQLL